MKVVVILHDYLPSHLYAGDEGGGDLARQEEDVQHLPPWSLLLLCLHWIQHIVTNTGDYHDLTGINIL